MDPRFALAALIVLIIAAFFLGWDIAEARERKAKEFLNRNIKLLSQQKQELTTWVRTNWPNEYEAYKRGHIEGYQQGILQSAELEE